MRYVMTLWPRKSRAGKAQRWLRELAASPARLRSKKGVKKPNTRELDKTGADAVRLAPGKRQSDPHST